jgi:plasmid stabilization system protein ParE
MPCYEIRVAASAMADIKKISEWWSRHRSAAPRLFDRELDTILGLLEHHPGIGRRIALRAHGEVRSIVLHRSQHVVMYRLLEEERAVWIVRVRHTRRRPLQTR